MEHLTVEILPSANICLEVLPQLQIKPYKRRQKKIRILNGKKPYQEAYNVCNLAALLRFSLIKPGVWDQKVQMKNSLLW